MQAIDPFPLEDDLTVIRFVNSSNEVKEGGFAGPVRTDETGDAICSHIERYIVHRFDSAKIFTNTPNR